MKMENLENTVKESVKEIPMGEGKKFNLKNLCVLVDLMKERKSFRVALNIQKDPTKEPVYAYLCFMGGMVKDDMVVFEFKVVDTKDGSFLESNLDSFVRNFGNSLICKILTGECVIVEDIDHFKYNRFVIYNNYFVRNGIQ